MQLNAGSELQNGKYRIVRVLGQGGFGITYLAEHTMLEKKVAIKEFFPKQFCDRENSTSHVTIGTQSNIELVAKLKKRFLKEARNISRLNHPGIINIHDIFEENNSAYYVMDYIEGESLSDIVKREGAMDENRATYYIKKVGEALEYIHSQNMTHFDVKPANIMVRKNDDFPILIDFGLSKQYNESGEATTTGLTGVSKGFSAIELTNLSEVTTFSEQSDVYSLGATLLYLLTGTIPPDASALVSGIEELTFPAGMSDYLRKAITSAMEVNRKKRCKNVKEFLEIIDSGNTSGKSTFVPASEASEYSIPPSSVGDNDDTQFIDVKPENYYNSTSAYSSISDETDKNDMSDISVSDTDFDQTEESKNNNFISWWIGSVVISFIAIFVLVGLGKTGNTSETDYVSVVEADSDIVDEIEVNGVYKSAIKSQKREKAVQLYDNKNFQESLPLIMHLAENEDCVGQVLLGHLYYFGYCVTINKFKAYLYYKSSLSNRKDHFDERYMYYKNLAEYNMGQMYLNGDGIEHDYAEAMKYFMEGAKKEFSPSEYKLGYMYEQGLGCTDANWSTAIDWYRKSYYHGNQDALKALKRLEVAY